MVEADVVVEVDVGVSRKLKMEHSVGVRANASTAGTPI